jgi:hypothetical protein
MQMAANTFPPSIMGSQRSLVASRNRCLQIMASIIVIIRRHG